MKRTCLRWLCPVMVIAGLVWFTGPAPVLAQERERGRSDERLDQLERRIDERFGQLERRFREMAERQEQLMKREGPALERRIERPEPRPESARPPMLPPGGPPCPMPPKCCPFLGVLLFVFAIINILMAIWIYTDIRKRGEGHFIFVAMAVLAGIPTGIIYALVRIGDRKP